MNFKYYKTFFFLSQMIPLTYIQVLKYIFHFLYFLLINGLNYHIYIYDLKSQFKLFNQTKYLNYPALRVRKRKKLTYTFLNFVRLEFICIINYKEQSIN